MILCIHDTVLYDGKLRGELFHFNDIGGNKEEEDEEDDEEEGHHFPRPPVQEVRPGDHLPVKIQIVDTFLQKDLLPPAVV